MPEGCGRTKQFGHAEVVACGDVYYTGLYLCPKCKEAAEAVVHQRIKDLEACLQASDAYIGKLVCFATDNEMLKLPRTPEQDAYETLRKLCGWDMPGTCATAGS
jgi:hypothetical protein